MTIRVMVTIILVIHAAWSHNKFTNMYTNLYGNVMGNINWDPDKNGYEDTYMQFTSHWKKEIINWAKDCIMEIRKKIYQLDQINWASADDLRHNIGLTIGAQKLAGRIMELHRQQVDMYRRMKRIIDNRFNWLRPEISGKYPEVPQADGIIEPIQGKFDPDEYNRDWARGGKRTHYDYNPRVYMVALEYITKRETDIEHLVKLLTDYLGEEEVGWFKPKFLPADQQASNVWESYTTAMARTEVWYRRGQGPLQNLQQKEEDRQHDTEEVFKAKMRQEYFKKRGINNK